MILKKFCSRFATPRVKISHEAFENFGIEVFSSERVPFSDRTGPEIAKNLTAMLASRVESLQRQEQLLKDGIHVYELGAGTGILAKRILDLLKSNYPHIYSQVVLHLSDISKPALTQLKAMPVFKVHGRHVLFEVIDALNPAFAHKPLLVYFTNLIDALPHTRQILVKDGQISEFQVQTSLKKDAQIIDATYYPPKILERQKIVSLFSPHNTKKRMLLAPQILQSFEEKSRFVPVDKVSSMTSSEQEDLKNLVQSKAVNVPYVFNYNYPARMVILKVIRDLHPGGFIFFSDFGISSGTIEEGLQLECGLTIFFTVDFPSYKQLAESAAATCYLTSNPPGYPQEIVIDILPNDQQMASLFQNISVDNYQTQVNAFLEGIKTILLDNQKDKSQKSEEVNRLYASLSEELKSNYQLLSDLPFFLLQAGFYIDADVYADILQKKYGHSVGVYYDIIKGKVQQEKGDLKAAEKFFKEAADNHKGFIAYAYMAELYWQQMRYLDYIRALKKYLKFTRKRDHLTSLLSIASAQEKSLDPKTAKKTLAILIALGQKLKKISEQEKASLEQARKLL